MLRRSFQLLRRSFQLLRHGIPWELMAAKIAPGRFIHSELRVRNKGLLTEVLKRSVNHKSWLTGFRSFVRIPSTIPTGTSRLDIWIFRLWYPICCCTPNPDFCVVHPCRGLVFPEKTHPWCFCNLKQCFLHSTKTMLNGTAPDRRGLKS